VLRHDVPVEIRRGDFDDPLAGAIRIGTKPDQIDVVVGRWKWEQAVVERSQPIEVQPGITIPVVSRSDLILLKLAAGGPLDYVDAYNLLMLGPRDEVIAEVESKLADLPRDAKELWQRLLADVTPPSP